MLAFLSRGQCRDTAGGGNSVSSSRSVSSVDMRTPGDALPQTHTQNNPLITSQPWPTLASIFLWLSPHRHCMLQVFHSHWCSHSLCNPMNLATSYGSSVARAASCLHSDYGPALALANQPSSPLPSGLQLYLFHQGWNTN